METTNKPIHSNPALVDVAVLILFSTALNLCLPYSNKLKRLVLPSCSSIRMVQEEKKICPAFWLAER